MALDKDGFVDLPPAPVDANGFVDLPPAPKMVTGLESTPKASTPTMPAEPRPALVPQNVDANGFVDLPPAPPAQVAALQTTSQESPPGPVETFGREAAAGKPPGVSGLTAFGHGAKSQVGSALGGAGAMALASWALGPEVGAPVTLGVLLLAAIGGGFVGGKAQEAVETVGETPEQTRTRQVREASIAAEHPAWYAGGSLVPALIGTKGMPVGTATRALGIGERAALAIAELTAVEARAAGATEEQIRKVALGAMAMERAKALKTLPSRVAEAGMAGAILTAEPALADITSGRKTITDVAVEAPGTIVSLGVTGLLPPVRLALTSILGHAAGSAAAMGVTQAFYENAVFHLTGGKQGRDWDTTTVAKQGIANVPGFVILNILNTVMGGRAASRLKGAPPAGEKAAIPPPEVVTTPAGITLPAGGGASTRVMTPDQRAGLTTEQSRMQGDTRPEEDLSEHEYSAKAGGRTKLNRQAKTDSEASLLRDAGVEVDEGFLNPEPGVKNHITGWTKEADGTIVVRVETHTETAMHATLVTARPGDRMTYSRQGELPGASKEARRVETAPPGEIARPGETQIEGQLGEKLTEALKPAERPEVVADLRRIETDYGFEPERLTPTEAPATGRKQREAGRAQAFADKMGVELVWFKDAKPEGSDFLLEGLPGPTGTRRVFVSVDANSPLASVVRHEIFHQWKTQAPDAYQRTVQAVKAALHATALSEYTKKLEAKRGTVSPDMADEEFLAETFSQLASNRKFLEAAERQEPGIIGRVADVFRKIVENIKTMMGVKVEGPVDEVAYGNMRKYIRDMEAVEKSMREAYRDMQKQAGEAQGEAVATLAGEQKTGSDTARVTDAISRLDTQIQARVNEGKDTTELDRQLTQRQADLSALQAKKPSGQPLAAAKNDITAEWQYWRRRLMEKRGSDEVAKMDAVLNGKGDTFGIRSAIRYAQEHAAIQQDLFPVEQQPFNLTGETAKAAEAKPTTPGAKQGELPLAADEKPLTDEQKIAKEKEADNALGPNFKIVDRKLSPARIRSMKYEDLKNAAKNSQWGDGQTVYDTALDKTGKALRIEMTSHRDTYMKAEGKKERAVTAATIAGAKKAAWTRGDNAQESYMVSKYEAEQERLAATEFKAAKAGEAKPIKVEEIEAGDYILKDGRWYKAERTPEGTVILKDPAGDMEVEDFSDLAAQARISRDSPAAELAQKEFEAQQKLVPDAKVRGESEDRPYSTIDSDGDVTQFWKDADGLWHARTNNEPWTVVDGMASERGAKLAALFEQQAAIEEKPTTGRPVPEVNVSTEELPFAAGSIKDKLKKELKALRDEESPDPTMLSEQKQHKYGAWAEVNVRFNAALQRATSKEYYETQPNAQTRGEAAAFVERYGIDTARERFDRDDNGMTPAAKVATGIALIEFHQAEARAAMKAGNLELAKQMTDLSIDAMSKLDDLGQKYGAGVQAFNLRRKSLRDLTTVMRLAAKAEEADARAKMSPEQQQTQNKTLKGVTEDRADAVEQEAADLRTENSELRYNLKDQIANSEMLKKITAKTKAALESWTAEKILKATPESTGLPSDLFEQAWGPRRGAMAVGKGGMSQAMYEGLKQGAYALMRKKKRPVSAEEFRDYLRANLSPEAFARLSAEMTGDRPDYVWALADAEADVFVAGGGKPGAAKPAGPTPATPGTPAPAKAPKGGKKSPADVIDAFNNLRLPSEGVRLTPNSPEFLAKVEAWWKENGDTLMEWDGLLPVLKKNGLSDAEANRLLDTMRAEARRYFDNTVLGESAQERGPTTPEQWAKILQDMRDNASRILAEKDIFAFAERMGWTEIRGEEVLQKLRDDREWQSWKTAEVASNLLKKAREPKATTELDEAKRFQANVKRMGYIKAVMAEMDASIADLVKMPEEQAQNLKDVVLARLEGMGFPEADLAKFRQAFDENWTRMIREKRERMLQTAKDRFTATTIKKIYAQLEKRKYDYEWGRQQFARQYGLQTVDKEFMEKLSELQREYVAAGDKFGQGSRQELLAMNKMQMALAERFNRGISEVWWSAGIAGLLSGPRTHVLNFALTHAQAALGGIEQAEIQVGRAVQQLAKGDIQAAGDSLAAIWRSYWYAWNGMIHMLPTEAGNVLATGQGLLKSSEKYEGEFRRTNPLDILKTPAQIARDIKAGNTPSAKEILLSPLALGKFVRRVMMTEDLSAYIAHNEQNLWYSIIRTLQDNEGLTGKPLMEKATELMGYGGSFKNADVIKRATAEGEKLGLTKRDLSTFVLDRLNAARPEQARKNASVVSLLNTFNNPNPKGFSALPYEIARQYGKNSKLVRVFTLFSRTLANVYDQMKSYSPLGLGRTITGLEYSLRSQQQHKIFGKNVGGLETIEPERLRQLRTKAVNGLLLTAALATKAIASYYEWEDKKKKGLTQEPEPWFSVHGPGPKDPATRAQWASMGHKPYEVKFGNQRFALWTLAPVAIPLATVGSYLDYMRYTDPQKQVAADSGSKLAMSLIAGTGSFILTQSPAQMLSTVMGGVGPNADEGAILQAFQSFARLGRGMAIPASGLTTQLQEIWTPERVATKGPGGTWKALIDNMPVVEPALYESKTIFPQRDVWGQVIKRHFWESMWGGMNDKDPIGRFLMRNNMGLRQVPRGEYVPYIDPKNGMPGYRQMTDAEYDLVTRVFGGYLREGMEKKMGRLESIEADPRNADLRLREAKLHAAVTEIRSDAYAKALRELTRSYGLKLVHEAKPEGE